MYEMQIDMLYLNGSSKSNYNILNITRKSYINYLVSYYRKLFNLSSVESETVE